MLVDPRAFYVANFLLDDLVIVLDDADVAGFVLVDDELVGLFRPGRDFDDRLGIDDARMIDVAAVLDDLGAVVVLRRRTLFLLDED